MLVPRCQKAVAKASASLEELEAVVAEYMAEGREQEFDFDRVRRDMSALLVKGAAGGAGANTRFH